MLDLLENSVHCSESKSITSYSINNFPRSTTTTAGFLVWRCSISILDGFSISVFWWFESGMHHGYPCEKGARKFLVRSEGESYYCWWDIRFAKGETNHSKVLSINWAVCVRVGSLSACVVSDCLQKIYPDFISIKHRLISWYGPTETARRLFGEKQKIESHCRFYF